MKLKQKIFSSFSLILTIILPSCSSGNIPSPVSVNSNHVLIKTAKVIPNGIIKEVRSANGEINYIADVGNGIKTGNSITIKLNLTEGLKTKAFSDGTFNEIKSNTTKFQFYLVNNNSGNLSGAAIIAGTGATLTITIGAKFISLKGSGPTTLVFSNIAPTVTGDIWVAGAAFKGVGPFINQTSLSSPITINDGISLGSFAVSTSGGDGTGKINISNNLSSPPYKINTLSPIPLNLNIPLQDALGASIDSSVTVNDGNAIVPPASAQ